MNDLWNFSKALNETTNYCEALGVLRELKIRTQNQVQVKVALEELIGSGLCSISFDEPIKLKQSSSKGMLVLVTLNDVSGTFVLDTGASVTTISSGFAQKLGIEPKHSIKIPLQTANGIAFATPVKIDALTFGQNVWAKSHNPYN